jgi:hypothetical protein
MPASIAELERRVEALREYISGESSAVESMTFSGGRGYRLASMDDRIRAYEHAKRELEEARGLARGPVRRKTRVLYSSGF